LQIKILLFLIHIISHAKHFVQKHSLAREGQLADICVVFIIIYFYSILSQIVIFLCEDCNDDIRKIHVDLQLSSNFYQNAKKKIKSNSSSPHNKRNIIHASLALFVELISCLPTNQNSDFKTHYSLIFKTTSKYISIKYT
jgi:hypothetical protein